MRPADSTASSEGDASLAASIGGYLGILVVTVGATLITTASGLGDEYRPPEQMVSSAITVAAVAAVLVAAISAGAFLYTTAGLRALRALGAHRERQRQLRLL
jgi:transcriptional regulator GlxA family with amidase domain